MPRKQDPKFRTGQQLNGRTICGAKTRRGTPCEQTAMTNGTGRCRMHGGNNPRGVDHPNFKHGRHSKYLPKRVAENYEALLNDPELMQLRHDVALIDARLLDLLSQLADGEGPGLMQQIREGWHAMQAADRAGDADQRNVITAHIDGLIRVGQRESEVWDEVLTVVEQKRKLVETEQRRIKASRDTYTADQFRLLLNLVGTAAREVIRDPDTRDEFARRLIELGASDYRLNGGA